MRNASEAVTNAYNQGVRDGIRRLADSIKGTPTGDVSSLLQDARRGPQEPAEALSTGPAAVRPTGAYEDLQEALRDLYRFVVEHLDPEPGPVQEYVREAGPQAAAIEAVGEENWSYADHDHPLDWPKPHATSSPDVADADVEEGDPITASEEATLAKIPEPQRSFLRGFIEGRDQ